MKTKLSALLVLFLMSMGATAQIDRSKQPQAGPAPEITLEKPQEFKLKNGIKVLVVENHKLPRVSYSLRINNKPIIEGDKAGVTSILSAMLGNGTTSIAKDDFNEEIDFLGANVNISFNGGFASSLSKYSDRILELMADAAINPLLTQEEFDSEKNKLVESLKQNEKSVDAIASRVGSALSYGTDHAYGEFTTEETINNISFEDAQSYYNRYFNPNNAYIVVVGDVEYKKVKKQIKKYFSKWKKAKFVADASPSVVANPSSTEIDFVDMPNATQSNISVTNNVDLKMSDADYHAALITNNILGGGGEGYLFLNLREKHGYTYGSYSSLGASRYGVSRFSTSAKVRNMVTDSAIVQTLKEIKRIKTEAVDAETLKNAKAKYLGRFVMALERPQTIANYALNIKLNNLPEDFYATYLQKINDVTVEDVKRVANKYFKSNNARVVVIGKGSEVIENLEKTGIPINYYDTYANPTEKPEFKVELPAGVTTTSVLNNYINAVGGEAKIKEVNSLILKYEASAMGATILNEEKRVDGKLAQNIFMNGAPMMSIVVTNDEVFMKRGGAKNPLPPAMANDMKTSAGLFAELNLLNSDKAKLVGIEKVDAKDAYRIDVAGEMVSMSLFYDVATGLKVKEIQTTTMNGQSQVQETLLKDYQEFEGLKFPMVKDGEQMGQPITSKLTEVIVNKDVTDADFN